MGSIGPVLLVVVVGEHGEESDHDATVEVKLGGKYRSCGGGGGGGGRTGAGEGL